MRLKIVNTVTELDLQSEKYYPEYAHPDYSLRTTKINRYGRPGVELTGDRQAGSRDIRIQIKPKSTTDVMFISEAEKIIEALNPEYSPIFLVDTDNNRRAEIELSNMRVDSLGGQTMRGEKFDLTLPMLDSVWESLDLIEYTSESGGTASGDVIAVDNPGIIRAYPIIEIIPTQLNNDFAIFNNSTQDVFRFGSNAFTVGTKLIIDSVLGQVWFDDGISRTEVSSSVVDGSGLLYLRPGVNDIEYDSAFGPADITVKFRRRFPF